MIDRKKNMDFGIILAVVLKVIELWRGVDLTTPMLVTLLAVIVFPKVFTPFTWLWFKLGEGLGMVVTRCILFLLFFLVVTPIGCIRRWMKKDPLLLRAFGKGSGSVFICREKTYEASDLEKQH